MKIRLIILIGITFLTYTQAQQMMTPELLWKLKRVSPIGISEDGNQLIYSVTSYEVEAGEKTTKKYIMPVNGGNLTEIEDISTIYTDKSISPDKTRKIEVEKVKLEKVKGSDFYPDLKKSNVYIYNDLDYRHWDEWNDGTYNHLILTINGNTEVDGIDIMKGEPYYSPQMPFGGDEDYTWNNDGTQILYVSKK